MKNLIVLRGIPGTGKSTLANKLVSTSFEQGRMATRINRDELRMDTILCMNDNISDFIIEWDLTKEYIDKYFFTTLPAIKYDYKMQYQNSFKSKKFNDIVNEVYRDAILYNVKGDEFQDIICDATNLKEDDLKWYRKTADEYKCKIIVYDLEKEYGSIHDVPEPILVNCRALKEKTQMLAIAIADKFLEVK